MRARDVIYEGLLVRRGLEVTEDLARERANNISTAVIEALAQLAEESKPPPVRNIPSTICTHPTVDVDGKCSACGDVPEWVSDPVVKRIK